MNTGKQVLTKPHKKVGVPHKKWRTEEGKGGEPAVPCRERLSGYSRAGATRSAKGEYRQVRSRRALGALKPRGLLAREGF
jgi:hypothetical protein